MNDIDYSDAAELQDWNTQIDNRFLTLLKADGITTMGQLLELSAPAWVHKTKGASSKARMQISRAKETILERRKSQHDETRCLTCTHRRDSHSMGKYACDSISCADNCVQFLDPSPFAIDVPRIEATVDAGLLAIALARGSLIARAIATLRSMQKVLDNESGHAGWEQLQDRIDMVHAQIRALLGELLAEQISESVPRDDVMRAVIAALEEHMSADATSLFDTARWVLDALSTDGWLIVRADSISE